MNQIELNNTIEESDTLGRFAFAKRLTSAIDVDFNIQDESYVLLLTGRYGSGKTTFLEMWSRYLTAQGYKIVKINAWETGFEESPVVPILYELSKLLSRDKFKSKIKKVLPYLTLAGSTFINIISGLDPIVVAEQLDTLKDNMNNISTKIFDVFKEKYLAITVLKDALKHVCSTNDGKPIYIFIDELDRLIPAYAVAYLEIIKHFFSVRGIVFVIAADKEQLYNGIQHNLGFRDAPGYLLRFITREACIPSCSKDDMCKFINDTWVENLSNRNVSNIHDVPSVVKNFVQISFAFQLTLREIQMILRCLTYYLSATEEAKKNVKINFGGLLATFFMLCLYQKDHERYNLFGSGKIVLKEVFDYLYSKLPRIDDQIINNIVTSILLAMMNRQNYEGRDSLPLNESVKEMIKMSWDFYGPGFDGGRPKSIISDVYDRIQGWIGFFENIVNVNN